MTPTDHRMVEPQIDVPHRLTVFIRGCGHGRVAEKAAVRRRYLLTLLPSSWSRVWQRSSVARPFSYSPASMVLEFSSTSIPAAGTSRLSYPAAHTRSTPLNRLYESVRAIE
jgi:hypothetical protein